MRRAIVALVLVPLLGGASDSTRPNTPIDPCPHRVTAKQFRPFAAAVWRPSAWQRGKPPAKTIRAQRHKLACAAGPGHRRAMKRRWRAAKSAYYAHRRAMLFRERVTPFYGCTSIGGCGYFAIPASIVDCESGGRFNDPSAPNGAYSLLSASLQGVATWETWRPRWAARYALPYQAPRKAQDIAAHRLWLAYGSQPWAECA